MSGERILGPALRLPSGIVAWLPEPARHSDVVKYARDFADAGSPWDSDQGFYTSGARYVSRHAAWRLADDAGQITKPELARRPAELFTECMW